MSAPIESLRMRLRHWRLRSGHDNRLLMCGMTAPPLIWICLHTAGFARTLRWFDSQTRPGDTPPSLAQARDIAGLLRRGARLAPFGATCLTHSLLACRLLRQRGFACELRMGVRPSDTGGIEAHAWIEAGDDPLEDENLEGVPFTPFEGPIGSIAAQQLRVSKLLRRP